MIVLKLLSYNAQYDCFECQGSDEKLRLVDLRIDGGLKMSNPRDLVGATVECQRLDPYIEIASGMRLVAANKEPMP